MKKSTKDSITEIMVVLSLIALVMTWIVLIVADTKIVLKEFPHISMILAEIFENVN